MNIALYGVSRCGKNFLIERLLESINKKEANTLYHVNGSGILDRLSNEKFGIPLKETEEWQKNELRLIFCDEIKKLSNDYKNIIVDGHYCFYKNDDIKIAFTDKDRDVYDYFFYLDTQASVIIKQANKDAIKKDIAFMTEDKINAWKEFEIMSLREICLNHDKEFVVLDNNIEDCIDFFEALLLGTRNIMLNSKLIAEYIIEKNQKYIDNYQNVILLDCDRTISDNDTTYNFCISMGICKQNLKNIFQGEHYSSYQFFRTAKLYAGKDISLYDYASTLAMKKAVLNMSLIDDIKHNGSGYLPIGITSGVFGIWRKIQEKHKFPCIIEGGSNIKIDKFIVSRTVKYQIVRLLHEIGIYIIAVGDSMGDIDMLNEADEGFIIAQEKRNETLETYFKTIKTEIVQLEYNKLLYDGITVRRSIFS